ncbi:MAG TPA: LuxR C-terminal-related transcriptional regulator [Ktedonobacterales bacterium]
MKRTLPLEQPFFLTKLAIPQTSPSLLVQTGALDRLRQASGYPLTLLNAPAGSGKTTLLAMWAACARLPVAWVSLDADDNDPARFWTYLLMAIETCLPGKLAPGYPWLQKPHPHVAEQAFTLCINALKATTAPLALALDDYHLLASDNQALHEMVGLLLERLPPQAHLVVSSRSEPPLPLPRLRARGLLLELRAPDLRLTRLEAGAFLQARLGQPLPAERIETLYARTEGWAAGLQFATISIQHQGEAAVASFSGRDRYLVDYFTEEALRRLPASLQLFLLQTSVLERLCAQACDMVCGITDSQEQLETLERRNLFIEPLDHQRQWYRYHPLFAEVLRLRLEQALPERIAELHARASRWYEAQGSLHEAIRHAFTARDVERAARLIESAAPGALGSGDFAHLREWLGRLPDPLLRTRPALSLVAARVMLLGGQLDACERALLQAEAASLRKLRPGQTLRQRALQGGIAAARASLMLARGNIVACIHASTQALETPGLDDVNRQNALLALGTAHVLNGAILPARQTLTEAIHLAEAQDAFYLKYGAIAALAQTALLHGRLQEALQLARKAARDIAGRGLASEGLEINIVLGALLYETNDLEGAISALEAGIAFSRSLRAPIPLLIGSCWLAMARAAQGAPEAGQELQACLEANNLEAGAWATRLVRSYQARLHVLQGNLEAASAWAREYEQMSLPEGYPRGLRDWEKLVSARVALATGKAHQALAALTRLRVDAEAGERMRYVLENLVLQAVGYEAFGETHTALTKLRRALRLAEREGFVRTIVDGGTTVRRLLGLLRSAQARRQHSAPSEQQRSYLEQLLAACDLEEREESQAQPKAIPLLAHRIQVNDAAVTPQLEPLSQRELEVLRLLAEGASNQEIAEHLVIALGTVKRHINTIFMKLGVQSRTQAIAVAHKRYLLLPTRIQMTPGSPFSSPA